MSIRMLTYFIKIVQNDNNLTKAASELYISQPALSRMLNSFEKQNNVMLFTRYHGRLNELTPVGKIFYEKSQAIVKDYHQAINGISEFSLDRVQIKVGIPTFILSDFCYSLVLDVALKTQSGRSLELVEGSSAEILEKFKNNKIDIALILSPSGLSSGDVDEHQVYSTEIDLFMHKMHPLNALDCVKWENLNQSKLVIPTEKSMLYHMITKTLDEKLVHPAQIYSIDSIDSIFQIIKTKEFISLLPRITKIRDSGIVRKSMEFPILWNVIICKHKNANLRHGDYINTLYQNLIEHISQNAEKELKCDT